MQMESIFDCPPSEKSRLEWKVDLPLPETWNIGVIVGPSGSGKTTIARELFGEYIVDGFDWDEDKSILDSFPKEMGIGQICELLSSVGFSSPPSWLRLYRVLSNGEKFRVYIARVLAESRELAVVDEFTSVVDRNVARIGSAAISKTVRKLNKRFIAISCHYDILEWLEPDWIYYPATNEFHSGRYLRRPEIRLEIWRVHRSAWEIFRRHHYLNTSLKAGSICFAAFWNDVPVAFTAAIPHPHSMEFIYREHRTVCLPDFQGVGIGNALSDFVASVFAGLGYRYVSTTAHPAMIRSRLKSPNWMMTRKPGTVDRRISASAKRRSWLIESLRNQRMTATFRYVGKPYPREQAREMLGDMVEKRIRKNS
jgi:hypothetical protein